MIVLRWTDDEYLDLVECVRCGDGIISPYGDSGGERTICSSCAAEIYLERRERRDFEKHTAESVVEWSCDSCSAVVECTGDCWRGPDIQIEIVAAKPQLHARKRNQPEQGRLF